MSDIEKEYMTWSHFDSDIEYFIDVLKKQNIDTTQSVILGLKRGGLPAAVALSNKLDIPVSLVAFQTRDANDIVPDFLEPKLIESAKTVIIPDDIYDSGLTIETVVKHLTERFGKDIENIIGMFHYHSDEIEHTSLKHYKVVKSNKGKWVVFPWE